jgi:hypothetical protein
MVKGMLISRAMALADQQSPTDLLDLGFDHGVLHVILQSLGVALTLLQNRLHDRVVLYDDQEAIEDQ